MPMWFGLLGPLQVRVGEPALLVPAAKQRVLLAALLLTPRQAVSSARLSELIWDGLPPGGSAVTLRSYVKRLRRVLGPAAGARIVTSGQGYLIDAADDEVDLTQYAALCGLAEAAVRSRSWQRAEDLLTRAQKLWRGIPLADIPCQAMQISEVPRLEQLKLQATEWRIQADLELGRCAKVVPELQALTAEHPLREPFHYQLMLALYRGGRQADALAAYRRARRVLVSEVGIEPGPDLRNLHQRILVGDLELASAAGQRRRATLARRPAPRQLPPAVAQFVGREAELQELTRLVNDGTSGQAAAKIAVIGGAAGVGKTALAVHWAHRVAELFPDGQLFLDLNGFGTAGPPMAQADAASTLLEALRVPLIRMPASLDGRIGLYRTLLCDRRVLVVLDNARDADQVKPLLPGGAGCFVLVTSRSPMTGLVALQGARALMLNVLSAAEARQMVAHRLGIERALADPAAIDHLIHACARLPQALAIATAVVATSASQSIAAIASSLTLAIADGSLVSLTTGQPTNELGAVLD